jgi:chromosome partitioning protein
VGRIICIANQKGGVGKTTTAVNLSASLALAGKRTLLIDLDPQGSASSGVGTTRGEGLPTTYDILMGESQLTRGIVASQTEGLFVLPASRDLIGAEIELVPLLAREHRLAEALRSVREQYDFILIDCPPSLGLLTVNGLTAADTLLVPIQCEYYALEGLSALMETVDLIRKRLNPGLQIEGLLLTMFDTRNSLAHQVADEVRQHFPREVFHSVVPRNVRLSEAPSHGVPAVIYDPSSKGAEAYQELAREIIDGRNQSQAANEVVAAEESR